MDYDRHWLSEAGKPVRRLVEKLKERETRNIFEAGCGSGYATALLAEGFGPSCGITAADISGEMIGIGRERIRRAGHGNVRFLKGDALRALRRRGPFDLVFTSWVLGYIPLEPFFETAAASLNEDGRLAFIVHKQNSPARELGIFHELVADDPSVLKKRIHFDFPEDRGHVERLLTQTGFVPEEVSEDRIAFRCGSPEGVMEHLLGSGAGTAFYDALDPLVRDKMEDRFKKTLSGRAGGKEDYDVVHEFVLCVARKSA
jgi:protein-L-isoaspartate O-methyltransferase